MVATLLVCFSVDDARADVPAGTFAFDGGVSDIAAGPDGTFLAGSFTRQQAVTGSAIAVDADSALRPFPRLSGRISAVIADGSGGWYVGGEFTGGGRSNLVHVDASGAIDSAFDPAPNGGVSALALSGGTLYVGGYFETIGGRSRFHLAAVSAATGAATNWNPNPRLGGCCGVVISALAVSDSSVFVGGNFFEIDGQARYSLAEIDAAGDATAFDAELASNGGPETPVTSLVVSGGTLYLAGAFDSVDGQARSGLAAITLATGAVTAWNPSPAEEDSFWGPWIMDIALSGSTLYVGGRFEELGGEARANLGAVDLASGDATAFDPGPDGPVNALGVSAGTVYAGGAFASIAGVERLHAAALDAVTGTARAFDPQPNGEVEDLAVAGSTVALGGRFTAAGAPLSEIAGLARLNPDGSLDTDFDPQPDAPVDVVAAAGGVVYAAGEFSSIGGQPRTWLGAVRASDGVATAWNPAPSGDSVFINALHVDGQTVYAGGRFEAIGGQPRENLAGLGAQTGLATAFAPNPDAWIDAVTAGNGTVYAAGGFSTIGGQSRNGLAALNATTGAAGAFNPSPDDSVTSLAMYGGRLYAGGYFSEIGGADRPYLAALDVSTGAATVFDAELDGPVNDIAGAQLSRLYLAGSFQHVRGEQRRGFAAVESIFGTVAPLAADTGFSAETVAWFGGDVHIGGFSGVIDGQPGPYARLSDPDSAPADITPPQITISRPAEGEHFAHGASVTTSFSCDDVESGVASCTGPATLDTATPGTKELTVVAVDKAGNQRTRSVSYVVDAVTPSPPGGGTTTDPVAADLTLIDGGIASLKAATLAKAAKSVRLTVPKDALPAGSTVTVTLSASSGALAARTVRIGKVTAKAAAGKATVLTVKLSGKARKTLRRRGKLKAKLSIVVKAPSGATRTKSRTLTLKRKR